MAYGAPSMSPAEALDRAWRDLLRAVRELPVPLLAAWAALSVLGLAADALPEPGEEAWLVQLAREPVFSLLAAVLAAPFAIAVHRLLLLGERCSRYDLVPRRRLRRYAGWLMAMTLMFVLPFALLAFMLDLDERLPIMLLLLIAFAAALSRLVLLLPAIAIDAPAATCARAWIASADHWLVMAVVVLLAALQAIAIAVMAAIAAAWLPGLVDVPPRGSLSVVSAVYALVGGAIVLLAYGLAACIASRLYERFGEPAGREIATPAPPGATA